MKGASRLDAFVFNSFIQAIDSDFEIRFQYFPEEISDSKSASWNTTEIIGRSHPILAYQSSDSLTMSLELHFFGNDWSEGIYNQQKIRQLMSLVYPDYSSGVKPPSRVLVSIGTQIRMVAVVSSVERTFKSPWDLGSGISMYVVVNLSLTQVETLPISSGDIKGGTSTVRFGDY